MNDKEMTEAIKNLRAQIDPASDTELRESLQAYGWVSEFPAIQDEHGVTLVGNRRMRIAKELGIQPIIKTLNIGAGDKADVERVKLAVVSNIGGKPLTPGERKALAIHIYQTHGWTQDRIGEALGVSRNAVQKYLAGLLPGNKPNSPVTNPVTNPPPRPKGGRPKGSGGKPQHRNPAITPVVKQVIAEAVLSGGKTLKQAATDAGVGTEQVAKVAVAEERGRREAFQSGDAVDPSTVLSKTANEKLEAFKRQAQRQLYDRYHADVQAEVERRVKNSQEYLLKSWLKRVTEADAIVKARRGFMSLITYNKIMFCLHPDHLGLNAAPEIVARHNEATQVFHELKTQLVAEKENPTEALATNWPKNWEELKARREEVRAAARAKRNAAGNGGTPAKI